MTPGVSFDSVVRVFATVQAPDYESPWQTQAPSSSTGSGVVIAPGQILTGAHVVANATFLQVQKVSDPDKAIARVVAICHAVDLALLEVEDKGFLSGVEAAELGGLPNLRDPVSVVGYPVGGDEVSVTEGVVSRIELQRYRHSRRRFLAITVDAAINSGNSGGPAFQGDKVVGIAFQTLEDAENIGELVPSSLIRVFLESSARGRGMQPPTLGARLQPLDNPGLRQHLGLGSGESGALVTAVSYRGSAWGHLLPRDVLLEVGGHAVANNGTVRYDSRFRVWLGVLFAERAAGDTLPLRVLRDGRHLELTLTLAPDRPLVPPWQYDRAPSYLVYAGLVFQPLSLDYIATWNDWWDKAPAAFLHLLATGMRTEDRQEVVVLANVLSDEINVGFRRYRDDCVDTLAGRPIGSLKQFAQGLRAASGPVEIRMAGGQLLVVDGKQVAAADARIAERYQVTANHSPDLAPQGGAQRG